MVRCRRDPQLEQLLREAPPSKTTTTSARRSLIGTTSTWRSVAWPSPARDDVGLVVSRASARPQAAATPRCSRAPLELVADGQLLLRVKAGPRHQALDEVRLAQIGR